MIKTVFNYTGMQDPSPQQHDNTFYQDASWQLDASVGGASISPSGRDVALVSTEGLQIVDLDHPNEPPRLLPHHSPGNIADIQWSPHASRDSWIIVAAGKIATLWDVAQSTPRRPKKSNLVGHNRSIADINFAVFNPDVLATCGLDTFVHLWDLRAPTTKPTARFADWISSSYQVKWNRQDQNILASSHDNRLHIWDMRKGTLPLRSIQAHQSKIYGVDWNRDYRENILTCSSDHTIKMWNWTRTPDPIGDKVGDPIDRIIRTPYPVWRARHTPFGYGIVAMPADEDPHLYLYDRRTKRLADRDAAIDPVHVFDGHRGRVQEFLWRYRGDLEEGHDMREFQLVSWGRNKRLCLHKLPKDTLAKVGFEKGATFQGRMAFTRRNAEYKTFRYPAQSSLQSRPLSRSGVPYVEDAWNERNIALRKRSQMSLKRSVDFSRTQRTNGTGEPHGISEIGHKQRDELLTSPDSGRQKLCGIKDVSHKTESIQDATGEHLGTRLAKFEEFLPRSEGLKSISAPFPRTCGATFAPNGVLVFFHRAVTGQVEASGEANALNFQQVMQSWEEAHGMFNENVKQSSSNGWEDIDSETSSNLPSPQITGNGESCSAAGDPALWSHQTLEDSKSSTSTSGMAGPDHAFNSGKEGSLQQHLGCTIAIYDVSSWFIASNQELARQYSVSGPPGDSCAHNYDAAEKLECSMTREHYQSVARSWRDAAILATGPLSTAQETISQILARCDIEQDSQTLATMTAVLAKDQRPSNGDSWIERLQLGSQQVVIEPVDQEVQAALKQETSFLENQAATVTFKNEVAFGSEQRHVPLLDPAHEHHHCRWRRAYGEQLRSWGLFQTRAAMLKYHDLGRQNRLCFQADPETKPMQNFSRCSLCCQVIRGPAVICTTCKHHTHFGCHPKHGQNRKPARQCPHDGCGCSCESQT